MELLVDFNIDIGSIIVRMEGRMILGPEDVVRVSSDVVDPPAHKVLLEDGPLIQGDLL